MQIYSLLLSSLTLGSVGRRRRGGQMTCNLKPHSKDIHGTPLPASPLSLTLSLTPAAHMEPIMNKARLLYIRTFPCGLVAFFNRLLVCVCVGGPYPRFQPGSPASQCPTPLSISALIQSLVAQKPFFPSHPTPISY